MSKITYQIRKQTNSRKRLKQENHSATHQGKETFELYPRTRNSNKYFQYSHFRKKIKR